MKICWELLENVKYDVKKERFRYKGYFIDYHDECDTCKEPFLSREEDSRFCEPKCRRYTEESKKKMSKTRAGMKHSLDTITKMKVSKQKENHPAWKGGVKEKNIPLYDTYAPQLEPVEQCRRQEKDPNILEVKCAYCGIWYTPKTGDVHNRIAREGCSLFYHSPECKIECPIFWKKNILMIILKTKEDPGLILRFLLSLER